MQHSHLQFGVDAMVVHHFHSKKEKQEEKVHKMSDTINIFRVSIIFLVGTVQYRLS